jgi:vancomycin resistance protein YoaR
MDVTKPYPQPESDLKSTLLGLLTALGTGLGAFLSLVFLLGLAFQMWFIGRIYPGVQVGDLDVSGIPRSHLVAALNENFNYQTEITIQLRDGEKSWTYNPAQLGVQLDLQATADAAYRVGRAGWPWERWTARLGGLRGTVSVAPQIVLDGLAAQNVLSQLAQEVNQPVKEAVLEVNGLNVEVEPGQVGRSLDTFATVALLETKLYGLNDVDISLVMVETKPLILDPSAQAEIARGILQQPLILSSGDNSLGPWSIPPETLAGMLKIERVPTDNGGAVFQIGLDRATLYAFLSPLQTSLRRDPVNARFIFNDETRQLEVIQQAVIGRRLLVEKSIDQINQQLAEGHHQVELTFETTDPAVTSDATAAELGISELVSAETTYFYGSSTGRIQNIQTAGSRFHGLLVAPGETFSMVENIGDISLETGFAEALIIYGDRTIAGVGGGVCQVSTTLFRTVFFGGYPIEERYPHAYRVYYYEQTASGAVNQNLAGLDATVYAPLVDFKFTNDTDNWLLMEVYVDGGGRSITWKFYSTGDGRQVDWTTTGLQNKEEPPLPLYEETDKLAKGEIEQVDWAVEGATVTITRTVTRAGEILHYDEIHTNYQPWRTICEYGVGTKGYPPQENKQDTYGCGVKGN